MSEERRGPGRPRTRPQDGPIQTLAQTQANDTELASAPAPRAAIETPIGNPTQDAAEALVEAHRAQEQIDVSAFVAAAEAQKTSPLDTAGVVDQLDEARAAAQRQKTLLVGSEARLKVENDAALRQARHDRKPLPPVKSHFRRSGVDDSIPVGRAGQPVVTPGKHFRWVAMYGPDGKQSTQRVNQMRTKGYDYVYDEGQPITNFNLIGMECDPEHEGYRVAELEHDLTSSKEADIARLQALEDDCNRKLRNGGHIGRGERGVIITDPTSDNPIGGWANRKGEYQVDAEREMALGAGLGV